MPGAAVDVVTFGEAMGSIRAAGLLRRGGAMSLTLGGAETNVAIGLARLGHTARWLGRIGADELGELVRRTLRAEGVQAGIVVDDARRTGLLLIEKRIADVSRVAYYRSGSAGSAVGASDLESLFEGEPRLLHVTGITPALSPTAAEASRWAVDAAVERGIPVSVDVNYRAALWARQDAAAVLTPLASRAAIVFASADELGMVASGTESDAVASLLDGGVSEVVVKRGGAGATAWHSGGELTVPARSVPVVDTIGAGDAFTAGYLSALLDDLPVADRLERGAVLGAFAVSGEGDWERLPNRAELPLLDRAPGHTER